MVNRAKECLAARGARGAAARRGIVARAESDGEIGARARRRADEAIARFRFPRPRVRASSDDGKLLDTILESMLRLQARGEP